MLWLILATVLTAEPDTTAPDLTLPLVHEEGSFRLAEHADKIVLVHFWATWCPPCKVALRHHRELARELPNLVAMAVNVDEANFSSAVRHYVKREQLPFVVARDVGAVTFAQWDPTGQLPYSALVVGDRRVMAVRPTDDEVREAIDQHHPTPIRSPRTSP